MLQHFKNTTVDDLRVGWIDGFKLYSAKTTKKSQFWRNKKIISRQNSKKNRVLAIYKYTKNGLIG